VSKHSASRRGLRVYGEGVGTVAHAGAVLLVETARVVGLDRGLSTSLGRWRRSTAVHDPGKIVLDPAVSLAAGGDCLADVNVLRAAPKVFGLVASDPTVSRLVAEEAAVASSRGCAVRRQRPPRTAGAQRGPANHSESQLADQLLSPTPSGRPDCWRPSSPQRPGTGPTLIAPSGLMVAATQNAASSYNKGSACLMLFSPAGKGDSRPKRPRRLGAPSGAATRAQCDHVAP